MDVVLAKVVAWSYILNMPYEMFLTIQMHLTCRKYHVHNHLQAKKDETFSEEQVTTVQDEE